MLSDKSEKTSQSPWPLIISGAVILTAVGSYFVFPNYQAFIDEAYQVLTSNNRTRISQWVSQFGAWGPFFIVAIMTLQMFLFIVPSIMLMVASVLAYGPWWGTLISLVAVFIASTIGWLIGRYLSRYTVDRLIGQNSQEKLRHYVEKFGFWAVIIFRISPFLSNDAISFVAGLMRMGYWKFILATMAGIMPLAIFIAILGEQVEQLIDGLIWVGGISLIAFIIYVIYERMKNGRKSK